MGKQELKRKETAVVSPNGEGKQYEQTLTVDDTCLPSAEELTAYQAIDPNIVTFLMDVSKKEQEHRHKMERDKLRVVDKNERRVFRLCKLNCVMLYSHSISSVGERPAPRGGTTRPDERKITII